MIPTKRELLIGLIGKKVLLSDEYITQLFPGAVDYQIITAVGEEMLEYNSYKLDGTIIKTYYTAISRVVAIEKM